MHNAPLENVLLVSDFEIELGEQIDCHSQTFRKAVSERRGLSYPLLSRLWQYGDRECISQSREGFGS